MLKRMPYETPALKVSNEDKRQFIWGEKTTGW